MPSPLTCPPADLESRIAALEQALWDGGYNEAVLPAYQAAFRELETRIADSGEDRRHEFVIVIPVADSPLHLRDCLASLLELCRAYGYGGQVEGRWQKVSVLLADDSGDAACIDQHRAIAREFDHQGLTTHYFGLDEQQGLMQRLAPLDLAASLGVHPTTAFHHKGQGMMRNLAYLKLAEFYGVTDSNRLFYSIDADQEFKVKVATPEGAREVLAVNFLYRLDEIFTRTRAEILTGKVVGDPPVSPAVMAGNFLEDVLGFLAEMAVAAPQQPWRQPVFGSTGAGDAAYHDMADLFGFRQADDPYRYRCSLPGEPDNAACFADFSTRLNRFFHGEHPTRITWFQHQDALASVQPARTIYTGNYVFRPEALAHFIPYAPLRLRMSGPTMGRLLKAEMGEGFVSANLPMLHKRTVETTGQSEFRPGILAEQARVDLCGEFERQFHGDVMLFSLQHLCELGYPGKDLPEDLITTTLDRVRGEMREKYRVKQQAIQERLALLQALLEGPARWWNQAADLSEARAHFQAFAANVAHNFGPDSPCYARIDAPGNWESWRDRQHAAITGLPAARRTWSEALRLLHG